MHLHLLAAVPAIAAAAAAGGHLLDDTAGDGKDPPTPNAETTATPNGLCSGERSQSAAASMNERSAAPVRNGGGGGGDVRRRLRLRMGIVGGLRHERHEELAAVAGWDEGPGCPQYLTHVLCMVHHPCHLLTDAKTLGENAKSIPGSQITSTSAIRDGTSQEPSFMYGRRTFVPCCVRDEKHQSV